MSKLVAFRVDGGSQLPSDEGRKRGMGHLSRCISIADELAKSGTGILFLMKNYPAGIAKVEKAGYRAGLLPADSGEDEDTAAAYGILSRLNPSAVVTDRLDTTAQYMSAMEKLNCPLINIDDLGPGRKMADALIYSLVRPPAEPSPNTYAGPEYMALDRRFTELHGKAKQAHSPPNILVSMGASDPECLTTKVIEALDALGVDFTANVIIGPAFMHRARLEEALARARRKYSVLHNAQNMPELMHAADIAIISGGVSVYEIACVGTPGIVLCQNEHENTNIFEDYGFARKLGMGRDVGVGKISAAARQLVEDEGLRQRMGGKGRNAVDGRGAERSAKIILGLLR